MQDHPIIESLEPRVLLAADWTVLVYMSTLQPYALDYINQLEAVGSTSFVNIVLQTNRGSFQWGAEEPTLYNGRRGLIEKDDLPNRITTDLVDMGTMLNMYDPQVLTDFITWSVQEFPAEKYALIMLDSGCGLDEMLPDGYVELRRLQYKSASEAVQAAGTKFDLLALDGSLMQDVDIAYEMAPCADYILASQNGMYRWPYQQIAEELTQNPAMTALQLGNMIASKYENSRYEISLVASAGVQALAPKLDALATQLVTTESWDLIESARLASTWFDDYYYIDLGMFLDYLAESGMGSVQAAAIEAGAAYQETIMFSYGQNATGLNCYLPENGEYRKVNYTYRYYSFLADTAWDDLVNGFQEAELISPTLPPGLYLPNLEVFMGEVTPQYTGFIPGMSPQAGVPAFSILVVNNGFAEAVGNINIDAYITATGDKVYSEPATNRTIFTAAQTINKSSILIGTVNVDIDLQPFCSQVVRFPANKFPISTELGSHLVVKIDSTNTIVEANEYDNYADTHEQPTVLWQVNVIAHTTTYWGDFINPIKTGEPFTFPLRVANWGAPFANPPFNVWLFASKDKTWSKDDIVLGIVPVNVSMKNYSDAWLRPTINIPEIPAGEYYFITYANFDENIIEHCYGVASGGEILVTFE